jgi:short subunit dehydrogenase-like uncharacterized protein
MLDIILFGSGAFAARIALDIAASAQVPVRLCIAGRNSNRVDWLRTAGNARAAIFGTKVRFTAASADLSGGEDAAELIARLPRGRCTGSVGPDRIGDQQ